MKKNFQIIYQGIANECQYDKLLASTSYTFELDVLKTVNGQVLDSKSVSATTPLSSKSFKTQDGPVMAYNYSC